MLANMVSDIEKNLPYYSNWAQLMLSMINAPYEVAIVGDNAKEMKEQFDEHFLPNTLFAVSNKQSTLEIFRNRYVRGKTLLYLCKDNVCKQPLSDVNQALELIEQF